MNWQEIWIKKGNQETTDLRLLNGYENTSIDEKSVADRITNTLGIEKETKVLEIGCGAGMLAQHLVCDYVGVDYSPSLVEKHVQILNNKVLVAQAHDLPFDDNSFDFVFAYSVFHYFKDQEYAKSAIEEMTRVSKSGLFVGDIPFDSHREEHLLYNKRDFSDWETEPGYYNPVRFNAWKKWEAK
jgi:ubiquinone/menaquinone biosynthesis C-methylase UbiE